MSDPFVRALESIQGDDFASELGRLSLAAARRKFRPAPSESLLQVRVPGVRELPATMGAAIAAGVQHATARIAKHLANNRATGIRRLAADAERFMLVQRGQVGNLVVFGFNGHEFESNSDLLEYADDPSLAITKWSELAALQLVETLPQSDTDDESLDAAAAAAPTVRYALRDLTQAAFATKGMGLELRFEGRVVNSVLTLDQAATLQESLDEKQDLEEVIFITGRLDGVRTRRRLFYLELDNGSEMHGLVEEDQVPTVIALLGKRITATIISTQPLSRGGRPGHKRYRLTHLAEPTELMLDE